MERTRRIVVTICVLLGVSLLTVLDTMFGGPRFVSSSANEAVDFTACWLPLVCIILLTRLPRSRARLLGFVVLVPQAAFCVLGGVGDAAGEAAFPATVLRQSSVRVGYSQIVTYYSNAGALDDGEVFVQQEVKLLPGLLWVKPILEPSYNLDVNVKVLDRHHIEYNCLDYQAGSNITKMKRSVAWIF